MEENKFLYPPQFGEGPLHNILLIHYHSEDGQDVIDFIGDDGEVVYNHPAIKLLAIKASIDPTLLAAYLLNRNDVHDITYNAARTKTIEPISTKYTPNDPGIDVAYDALTGLDVAKDIYNGQTNIKVAVIDTGCYTAHPDLQQNIRSGKIFRSGFYGSEVPILPKRMDEAVYPMRVALTQLFSQEITNKWNNPYNWNIYGFKITVYKNGTNILASLWGDKTRTVPLTNPYTWGNGTNTGRAAEYINYDHEGGPPLYVDEDVDILFETSSLYYYTSGGEPEFAGPNAIYRTRNIKSYFDTVGHGTAVCSVIGATQNNSIGISGVVSSAEIYPYKTDDVTSGMALVDVTNAIMTAANDGVGIINMSLGAITMTPGERAAVEYARSLGVIIVGAAGNEGYDYWKYYTGYKVTFDFDIPSYIKPGMYFSTWYISTGEQTWSSPFNGCPISYVGQNFLIVPHLYDEFSFKAWIEDSDKYGSVIWSIENYYPQLSFTHNNIISEELCDAGEFPSSADGVICVGATSNINRAASFSQKTPRNDISAPGVRVPVVVPLWSSKMMGVDGYDTAMLLNGTSFSSPYVAGVIAFIQGYRDSIGLPRYTRDEVLNKLYTYSTKGITYNNKNVDDLMKGTVNIGNVMKSFVGADPSISIKSSKNVYNINQPVTLTINALSFRNDTIDRVEISNNGELLHIETPTVASATFDYTTTLSVGDHLIFATVFDPTGASSTTSSNISIVAEDPLTIDWSSSEYTSNGSPQQVLVNSQYGTNTTANVEIKVDGIIIYQSTETIPWSGDISGFISPSEGSFHIVGITASTGMDSKTISKPLYYKNSSSGSINAVSLDNPKMIYIEACGLGVIVDESSWGESHVNFTNVEVRDRDGLVIYSTDSLEDNISLPLMLPGGTVSGHMRSEWWRWNNDGSGIESIDVIDDTYISAPIIDLYNLVLTVLTEGTFELSFNNIAGADSYRLYQIVNGTATRYPDADTEYASSPIVVSSTCANWCISAISDGNELPLSYPTIFTIPPTVVVQSGKANIINAANKVICGKTRISANRVATLAGKSSITLDSSSKQSISGKSNILRIGQKSVYGKANIQNIKQIAQSGQSKITASTARPQYGKANISGATISGTTVSENWDSAENTTYGLGALWSNVQGANRLSIYNHQVKLETGGTFGVGFYSGRLFSANQFSRIQATSSSVGMGLVLCANVSSFYYCMVIYSSSIAVRIMSGSSLINTIATITTPYASGNIYEFRKMNDKLYVLVNGSIVGDANGYTSAYQLTGYPGIVMTTTTALVDNWYGGDLPVAQVQTGKAKIINIRTVTQNSISRITNRNTKIETGIASISKVDSKQEFGKSRIQNSATKNINSISRIINKSKNDISGISNITKIFKYTQNGTSNIKATHSKQQTGLSRIIFDYQKQAIQTGIANIKNSSRRDISGISNITRIEESSLHAITRITNSVYAAINGRSRIGSKSSHHQNGLSSIMIKSSEDISGISCIAIPVISLMFFGNLPVKLDITQDISDNHAIRISNKYGLILQEATNDINGAIRIQTSQGIKSLKHN